MQFWPVELFEWLQLRPPAVGVFPAPEELALLVHSFLTGVEVVPFFSLSPPPSFPFGPTSLTCAAQPPDELFDRDPVDVQDVLGEADSNRLVLRVVAVGA